MSKFYQLPRLRLNTIMFTALTVLCLMVLSFSASAECSSNLLVHYTGDCDDPSDSFLPAIHESCVSAATNLEPTAGPDPYASCAGSLICMQSTYTDWAFTITAGGSFSLKNIEADFLYPITMDAVGGAENAANCPTNFNYEVSFYLNGALAETISGNINADVLTTEVIELAMPISANFGDEVKVKISGLPQSQSCDLFELGGLKVNGYCSGFCSDVIAEYGYGDCDDPADAFHPSHVASCISNPSAFFPTAGPDPYASCNDGILCINTEFTDWELSMTAQNDFSLTYMSGDFLYPVNIATAGGVANDPSCGNTFSFNVEVFINNASVASFTESVPEDVITGVLFQTQTPISVASGDELKVIISGNPASSDCALFETAGFRLQGCCGDFCTAAWEGVEKIEDITDCDGACNGSILLNPDYSETGEYYIDYTYQGQTTTLGPLTDNPYILENLCAGVYSNLTLRSCVTECEDVWPIDIEILAPNPPSVDLGDNLLICGDGSVELSANVTGGSTCNVACAADAQIAFWNFESCDSSGPNGQEDCTTLGPTVVNNGGCVDISASYICNYINDFSCQEDGYIGRNVCFRPDYDSFYEIGDNDEVFFTITLTPAAGETAQLSGISFYHATGIGPMDDNDFMGVRVKKDDLQVYFEDGIALSNNWELKNIDFSGPQFIVSTATTFKIYMMGYAPSAGAISPAWDIDELKVYGGCCQPTVEDDLTYEWSTGETTETITVDASGTYSLTVTDCNGCAATDEINVGLYPDPTITISGDLDICEGETTTLTAAGGVSYIWSTGETTESIDVTATGTYSVMAIDVNGCTGTAEVDVTVDNPIGGTLAGGPFEFCVGDGVDDFLTPGSITLTGNSGSNSQWVITDANGIILGLPGMPSEVNFDGAGEGACLVWHLSFEDGLQGAAIGANAATDLVGCYDLSNPITVERTTPDGGTLTGGPFEFCVGDGVDDFITPGAITLDGNSGTNSQWVVTDANGIILGLPGMPSEVNFEGAGAGACLIWHLSFEDGLQGAAIGADATTDLVGCYDLSNSIEVIRNPNPTASIDGILTICDGETTTLTADGGASYLWSPGGETTATIDVTAAGTYSVTVTDVNGCADDASVDVTVNPSPTAAIAGDLIICFGETTTLTASGGATYLWSPGGETTESIDVTDAGSYSVTVTDANGCEDNASVDVTVNPNPTAVIDGNLVICDGDNTTLTASGGSMYLWSPGGETTASIDVTTAGTYSVEIIDDNGCKDQTSVDVIVNDNPVAGITGELTICEDESTTLTASGGGSYLWSTTEMTESISVSTAGTYSVTVTNAENCTDVAEVDVVVNPLPTASIAGELTICEGDNTTLTASGGTSYLWSPGGETTASIDVTAAGNYSVVVTDDNGCEDNASVDVTVNPLPIVSAGDDVAICPGGTATLTATGGGSYLWSPGGATTASIDVTEAGVYTVTVLDDNLCSASADVEVTINPDALANAGDDVSICGGGSVTLTATGGGTYSWAPGGETTASIDVTTAGVYVVTVTDDNGCVDTDDVEVFENPSPTADVLGTTLNVCIGNPLQLTGFASGGTAPLELEWTANGGTFDDPTILTPVWSHTVPDTYDITLTVTDANNCTATASVVVVLLPSPEVTITPDATICAGETATITATGGPTYLWTPGGETTESIDVTEAGTYSVTVTNVSLCTASASSTITVLEPLGGTIGTTDPTNLCLEDGIDDLIDVSLTGEAGTNSQWVITDDTGVILALPAGPPFDFTNADVGTCLIWHLSFEDGLMGASIGANAATDLVGCYNLSNSIEVVREVCTSNLGNLVFNDLNQDGFQDPGESGVGGVVVVLYSAGPDGVFGTPDDVAEQTTMTMGNGTYMFMNVEPGDYQIEFLESTLPTGNIFTTQNAAGIDDAEDSDAGSNGRTETFTVVVGQDDDLTWDAGIYDPVVIGDYVWNDLNQNGIQNTNEMGVQDVVVNLIGAGPDGIIGNADDVVVDTQATGPMGEYMFVNVQPGDYYIEFDPSTLPMNFVFTDADAVGANDQNDSDADDNGLTPVFTVTAGMADNLSFDAGIYQPNTNIGNFVWDDQNQNGIQDMGEPGVNGVVVVLMGVGPDGIAGNADDTTEGTEMTSGNGNYMFMDVSPGTYYIEVLGNTIPADFVFTTQDAVGATDMNDSDVDTTTGATTTFTVTNGQADDLTWDAGIYNPISIGNFVWNDENQDGEQNAGEPGIDGVDVTLYGPGPDGLFHTPDDVIVQTATTMNGGMYQFSDLAPGNYCIGFDGATAPAGYVFTTQDAAAAGDAADSDADATGKIPAFTLTANQADDFTFDAGLYDPTTIGNFVFSDLNQDGEQTAGEPGVDGVTVNLISAGPDGVFDTADDVIEDTQVTGANGVAGEYLFVDVDPGNYAIVFDKTTIPAGTVFTTQDAAGVSDATDSDVDSNGIIASVTVVAGQADDLTFDAGIFDPVSIGNFVWYDNNQNGAQEMGEGGVQNVGVELFNVGPDGAIGGGDDVSAGTTMTDMNGEYIFNDVAPGGYYVVFDPATLPTDYVFTAQDAAMVNDGSDSDADATGSTGLITVTAGQADDLTWDAGIYNPVTIGNFVWFDDNKNGKQDTGEDGVEGMDVYLYSPGPDGQFHTADDVTVAMTTTDYLGEYYFTNVAPGDYCIEFDDTTFPVTPGVQQYFFTFLDAPSLNDVEDSDADQTGKTAPFTVVGGQDDDLSFDAGIIEDCALLPIISNAVCDGNNMYTFDVTVYAINPFDVTWTGFGGGGSGTGPYGTPIEYGPLTIADGETITVNIGETATSACGFYNVSFTADCAAFDPATCPDTDGDSVCDAADLCEGFDDAIDMDGDGIPDGCDQSILNQGCAGQFMPNLEVSSVSGTNVSVMWSNPNNDPYTLQYRITGTQNWMSFVPTNNFVILNGLQSCTAYEVQLVFDCNGIMITSPLKSFLTDGCDNCPAGIGLFTFNVTSSSAMLTWDIIPGATYSVEYKAQGEADWNVYETEYPLVILFGLQECAIYDWKIAYTCETGQFVETALSTINTDGCGRFNEDFMTMAELVDVYPNPAEDFFTVEYKGEQDLQAVQLFTIEGKLITEANLSETSINKMDFNVADLPKGMYMLHVRTSTNFTTKKVSIK